MINIYRIMNLKFIFFLIFLSVNISQSFSHSGKPKYHLVIDTDGATDDMRAITMLLASNDVRVLAITCSQGTLSPAVVYRNVVSLLTDLHHEGIPIGVADSVDFALPAWANFVSSVSWGDSIDASFLQNKADALSLLASTIEDYRPKVIFVALGSLKTYADLLQKHADLVSKVERVVWYNNPETEKGFNYSVSPSSYDYFCRSGIPFEIVGNTANRLVCDSNYMESIKKTDSEYARRISKMLNQPRVFEKVNKSELYLWDDLVALYINSSLLFDTRIVNNVKYVEPNPQITASFFNSMISKFLQSANATNNRVFASFPVDSLLYKREYAVLLKNTLPRYGAVEWKAICMTNEIHGHTGIYSIIGAKMGIRAMEYFNVGVNNLYVKSYLGNEPPFSCGNDGVQISTGSTIGQGLIVIADSVSERPSAVFEFNNQRIRLTLSEKISAQMKQDIRFGVKQYGLESELYWLYIEDLALKYWADYSRHEIFLIEKIK